MKSSQHFWSIAALSILVSATSSIGHAQSPDIKAATDKAKQTMPGVSPALIEAAAKEGKLVITSMAWGPEQGKMVAQFNSIFPFIKVETTQGSGGQVLAKFQAEAGARRGEGDIFQTSNIAAMKSLIGQNALSKHVIPADAQFAESDKSSGYWYSIHNTTPVMLYRKGALTSAELDKLKTWEGALDPAFKKRIGIPDISAGGVVLAGYQLFRARYGKDYFTRLAKNEPRIYSGLHPSIDALNAGEVDLVILASVAASTRRWQTGSPIEFVESSPKWASQTAQFVSAYAPHPNAAKLYQEWSMSKPAQELWQTLIGSPSARKGVADTRPYVKEPWFRTAQESIVIDWDLVAKEQKAISAEFNSLLKRR